MLRQLLKIPSIMTKHASGEAVMAVMFLEKFDNAIVVRDHRHSSSML